MIGMPEETIQTGSKIQLCIHTPENYWAYFNFSQAEIRNGLKSVETICYRAYDSCSSTFQSHRLDHIFSRGISIPCEKLKYAQIITI